MFAATPARAVPSIVGGTSAAALRRAARIGDGWQAVGRNPAELAADRARLRDLTQRPVEAGARIAWSSGQSLTALLAEIDRWRQAQPAHLAIWIGALAAAANRIAALGDALGREPR